MKNLTESNTKSLNGHKIKIINITQSNKIKMPNIHTNKKKKSFNFNIIQDQENILQNNKNQLENNEPIKDYLNLIRCTYPYCNCGKCIIRKNREHSLSSNYNYDKNIKSVYRNEFHWKSPQKIPYYKNANISHFDHGFKEHLKTGLISVMRNDYKNTLSSGNVAATEPNVESSNKSKKNLENNVQMNIPFLGRSSYESLYPNWETFVDRKNEINVIEKHNIPFSGKSSYKESFKNIEKKYYIDKLIPIMKKDNLEVGLGELINLTTTSEFFKPIDLKKSKEFNGVRLTSSIFPGFVSAPYSKDSFRSSYERAYLGNNFKYSVENKGNLN